MLPDGAHDRADDWTIFFLNQVPGLTVDSSLLTLAISSVSNDDLDTPSSGASARGSGSRKGKGRASDSEPQDGPPRLLYVMSLVRTQMDASVRRCVVGLWVGPSTLALTRLDVPQGSARQGAGRRDVQPLHLHLPRTHSQSRVKTAELTCTS